MQKLPIKKIGTITDGVPTGWVFGSPPSRIDEPESNERRTWPREPNDMRPDGASTQPRATKPEVVMGTGERLYGGYTPAELQALADKQGAESTPTLSDNELGNNER